MMKIVNICNKVIEYSFYSLMFFVPLALAGDTFELFEFNKMWLTFILTIIIGASWFIKIICLRQIFIQRTPLDIPIVLFLTSQIISTIFSWDAHISIWGYYSRFNGGLLSIISYIFLYYAFVSNFMGDEARGGGSGRAPNSAQFVDPKDRLERALVGGKLLIGPRAVNAGQMVKRLLFVSLLSGLVVALWGLPSHFGYDPTCLLFRETLDVSCWTADFQPKVRIFSTLGQPDWLAAYLAILLPISIAFSLNVILKPKGLKDPQQVSKNNEILRFAQNDKPISNFGFWIFLLLSALFYLALLYTRARSGVLATWLSLGFFFIAYAWVQRDKVVKSFPSKFLLSYWYVLVVFVVLVFITFFVGQPFSQLEKLTLEGIKKNITNTQPIENAQSESPATQRFAGELGGTDSGTIRKIVWQGAIDAWRHHPILGTGVETFAFAYYRFRPEAHNLTSEWNFLYNKAHNEYLNYLATTGAVGLGSYILMIGWFVFLSLKKLKTQSSKLKVTTQNSKSTQKRHPERSEGSPQFLDSNEILRFAQNDKKSLLTLNSNFALCTLHFALLAGYISILITNFFGFSVVITNIYLFMIPAFIFILGGMINPKKQFVFPSPESVRQPRQTWRQPTDRISLYQWTFIFFIILTSCFLILNLFKFWNADKAYALGSNLNKAGEYQSAYSKLQEAVEKRGGEPVFRDELAVNSAILAAALISQEETRTSTDTAELASNLAQDAITLNDSITLEHPNNIIFWKSRVRIFYALSQANSRYLSNALEAARKAQTLAPTDANISYNLGVLYGQNGDVQNGIKTLENTIRLKPDYRDAYYALGLFYHDQAVDENGNVVDRDKLNKAIKHLQYILDNLGAEDKVAKETLEQWKKL